jgi:hypothetical protein
MKKFRAGKFKQRRSRTKMFGLNALKAAEVIPARKMTKTRATKRASVWIIEYRRFQGDRAWNPDPRLVYESRAEAEECCAGRQKLCAWKMYRVREYRSYP